MDQRFDAIYENGILRPSTPLNLPEGAHVTGAVSPETASEPSDAAAPGESEAEVIAQQQAALKRLLEEVDRLPQHKNEDGWSVANNADDILYGGPNGPA